MKTTKIVVATLLSLVPVALLAAANTTPNRVVGEHGWF
jgi:hypothetical protein